MSCKENGLQTPPGPCLDFRKEKDLDSVAETGSSLNHISGTVNGDLERNLEGIAENDILMNDDTAVAKDDGDDSINDELIMQEFPVQKSEKAGLSSESLSLDKKDRPKESRQQGLFRPGRRVSSPAIYSTKARYKTQMSSPPSLTGAVCKSPTICAMQKTNARVQDSDDNDSVSDLVIDIP